MEQRDDLADPRRRRAADVHPGDGRGRHRAAPAGRPPGVPGHARSADPAAQPRAVLRTAQRRLHRVGRTGCRPRAPAGGALLRGPGRLRRDQRDAGAPCRRPAAGRRRGQAGTRLRARGGPAGGPARRGRVRRPGPGQRRKRPAHAARGRVDQGTRAALRHRRPAAGGDRQRGRGRAVGVRHHPHRPAEGRRRDAVLVEGRRAGPVDPVRPGARGPSADPAAAGDLTTAGARTRRVHRRVPAAGRAGRRGGARRRGTRPLAPPALRDALARPLHPARRGVRRDRAAGQVGA